MYEGSKDRQPQRNYYFLLPATCFGFWEKTIIRKLKIRITASSWLLQTPEHEASNINWQRIDLRSVLSFCT
jgi:hypothetical protein